MNSLSFDSNNHVASKNAAIYLRVSTEEQVENYSLSSQEEICRKEATKRGYKVAEVFREEGRSAKSITGRPILIQMLEYCRKKKNNINAVIVYRLDRISRQTSDYLAIRKKLAENEIIIISASEPTGDSPTEKLVETILAGFAQLDNDIKSERTKNGLRARFLSGLINTKPPLGYILQSGYVIKDPTSFDNVKKAWDLMATGTKSLSEIAHIMTQWGLRIKKAGRENAISKQSACRIFRSKFYMGLITSSRYPEEVRGQHSPMITEQQFYKVQSILDGRTRNKEALSQSRARYNPTFPLRRFARCGKCGSPLTGGYSRGNGGKYAYYRCGEFCTGKSIQVGLLELELIKVLRRLTPTEECKNLFINFIVDAYHKRVSRLKKIAQNADLEIAKLHDLRRQLVEKNLSGVYSDEIFKEQNAIIEDKILKAQIAKHDELFQKYNLKAVVDFMKKLFVDLGEWYIKSDLSQKRAFLGSIFPSGIAWYYPGYSNLEIRPVYQVILDPNKWVVTLGARERT